MSGKRHVRVERGIFRLLGASGGYEYNYADSDGKTRWATTRTLAEARQARAGKIAVDRSQRVAPTKLTVAEYAPQWLATQGKLRPSTRAWYEHAMTSYIIPRIGKLKLSAVTTDDVAALVASMEKGERYVEKDGALVVEVGKAFATWTIKGTLTPLGRMFSVAVRRGVAPSNPVRGLDKEDRPKAGGREMRTLARDEITALLDKCPKLYRPLVATALFTGTRQAETLALKWADIDFDAGVVHVSKQLARDGLLVPPKTARGVRDVMMIPSLAAILRDHREAAFGKGRAKPEDYVFASATGGPMHYRNVVRRGLDKAVKEAKLGGAGRPKLRWHDLRHTFASLLISEGLNVVYVSRQLGHSSPDITLRVYSHLFDQAEHGKRASDALEASFAKSLQRRHEPEPVSEGSGEGAKVARLQRLSAGGG